MNSSFPPFPIDLNEDHHHYHHLFSSSNSKITHEDYASSSSSISYPFFISPSSQDSPFYHHPNLHHEVGGSLGDPSVENEMSGNKFSICKKEDRENGSVKWMSSKMRLMRKMIKSDHQTVGNTSSENSNSVHKGQSSSSLELEVDDNTTKNLLNNNNNNNPSIRVCADCNTTKTPLWRSGPRGPKSLCNACGIRQRKARRALAAAQESGNGAMFDPESAAVKSKVKNKDQKTGNNSHLPFKKRCKFTAQGRGRKNKLCFEDLSSIILSKNSAFQQVFPQDEKEAAVLLMALSYGLVRS
ncbi:GATA transcription factor 21-like [Euphorbia lathyris]|uniref:GATA transcription factor 21-like n=1 Tax=Euphorbia lathyris TaxID=212925 RepID=UPI0033132825